MLNVKEFKQEEKQCADLLGMNLKKYRKYVYSTKISTKKRKENKHYDNSILSKLGLTECGLKTRKVL